ncbi:udp-glucose 4-epimerase [Nannochloropsis oceanica]
MGSTRCPYFMALILAFFAQSQAFAGQILVTGGAGYIGSHTCCELLKAGRRIVVVDNLINSVQDSLERVEEITGCAPGALEFRELDLLDKKGLEGLFKEYTFDACIHFAGLKAVGESVSQPMRYYHNNIVGTLNLLEVMDKHKCKNFVFSSSATVYGDPEKLPITEDQRLQATNPYGRTKLFIEEILRDQHKADAEWSILILRYFNPIGAHPSGRIGEDPLGIPNNLMPFVAQVCVGRRDALSVFGNDYATPDGTGVRDYIHVVDLAEGHVAAVDRMMEARAEGGKSLGCVPVNLGTGDGVSVLELVAAMRAASGKEIPTKMAERRPGDVASLYTDPGFANRLLKWKATRGVKEMCEDTWRWQSRNPFGYRKAPEAMGTSKS